MDNLQAALDAPAVNVTVQAARRREVRRSSRPREYLTERQIDKLMDAASGNRWGHRDATAILLAYRHGLRASELVALRWDDVDFRTGKLHMRRSKGGQPSVHPIGGRELKRGSANKDPPGAPPEFLGPICGDRDYAQRCVRGTSLAICRRISAPASRRRFSYARHRAAISRSPRYRDGHFPTSRCCNSSIPSRWEYTKASGLSSTSKISKPITLVIRKPIGRPCA